MKNLARSFQDLIIWQKLMLQLEQIRKLLESYNRAIVASNNRPISLSPRFGLLYSDF